MKKYQFKPSLIYFTGLSSSGKTTLSKLLKKKFENLGISSKYIDGDLFRKKFKLNKYDSKSREKVVIKKFSYAQTFLKMNKMIIISGIGARIKSRRNLRKKFRDFIEIRVDCPLKICHLRDKKMLYSKIKNKFVNIHYEKGNTHNLIVNSYKKSKANNIKKIIKYLIRNNLIF
jgi:adenylylsulfate kinase